MLDIILNIWYNTNVVKKTKGMILMFTDIVSLIVIVVNVVILFGVVFIVKSIID
jgi:hypothetical protein